MGSGGPGGFPGGFNGRFNSASLNDILRRFFGADMSFDPSGFGGSGSGSGGSSDYFRRKSSSKKPVVRNFHCTLEDLHSGTTKKMKVRGEEE